jgi:hypothetical protein
MSIGFEQGGSSCNKLNYMPRFRQPACHPQLHGFIGGAILAHQPVPLSLPRKVAVHKRLVFDDK